MYENSGFVFHRCSVEADPNPWPVGQNLTGVETFLGRPYRKYSHVIFMECQLSDVVRWCGVEIVAEGVEDCVPAGLSVDAAATSQ